MLEVHAKLEGHAAALAARRLSVEDGKALEKSCKACDQHAKRFRDSESDAYYQLNLNFHRAVGLAAHNAVLLDLIKTNARKLLAYYRARYRYKGSIAKSALEHRAIAALIIDRDGGAFKAHVFQNL